MTSPVHVEQMTDLRSLDDLDTAKRNICVV